MKKLLFILLIAFVVTTVVQTEDMELKEYKNINQLIASFSRPAKDIYLWLKAHGYRDKIFNLVNKGDSSSASTACFNYTGRPKSCAVLIKEIDNFLHKKINYYFNKK